MNVSTS